MARRAYTESGPALGGDETERTMTSARDPLAGLFPSWTDLTGEEADLTYCCLSVRDGSLSRTSAWQRHCTRVGTAAAEAGRGLAPASGGAGATVGLSVTSSPSSVGRVEAACAVEEEEGQLTTEDERTTEAEAGTAAEDWRDGTVGWEDGSRGVDHGSDGS